MAEHLNELPESFFLRAEIAGAASFVVVKTFGEIECPDDVWRLIRQYGKDNQFMGYPDPFDAPDEDKSISAVSPEEQVIYLRDQYWLWPGATLNSQRPVRLLPERYPNNRPKPLHFNDAILKYTTYEQLRLPYN